MVFAYVKTGNQGSLLLVAELQILKLVSENLRAMNFVECGPGSGTWPLWTMAFHLLDGKKVSYLRISGTEKNVVRKGSVWKSPHSAPEHIAWNLYPNGFYLAPMTLKSPE